MTDDQAKECWAFYFAAFPDSKAWMQKQGNKTLDIWKRVISNCEYDDVGAVVNKMIDGEMELPKAYERETTPQLVKRAANELRHARAERKRMTRLSLQATEPKDADGKWVYAMRFCITHSQPSDVVKRIIAWTHGGPHPGIADFAETEQANALGQRMAKDFARQS